MQGPVAPGLAARLRNLAYAQRVSHSNASELAQACVFDVRKAGQGPARCNSCATVCHSVLLVSRWDVLNVPRGLTCCIESLSNKPFSVHCNLHVRDSDYEGIELVCSASSFCGAIAGKLMHCL